GGAGPRLRGRFGLLVRLGHGHVLHTGGDRGRSPPATPPPGTAPRGGRLVRAAGAAPHGTNPRRPARPDTRVGGCASEVRAPRPPGGRRAVGGGPGGRPPLTLAHEGRRKTPAGRLCGPEGGGIIRIQP